MYFSSLLSTYLLNKHEKVPLLVLVALFVLKCLLLFIFVVWGCFSGLKECESVIQLVFPILE